MYCGQIAEQGNTKEVIGSPCHPYTKALLKSYESLKNKDKELYYIEGIVPSIKNINEKCRFVDRCDECNEKCKKEENILQELSKSHYVRCGKYRNE